MTDPSPNAAQRECGAYRLPAADPALLCGDPMRGVRFLLEFARGRRVGPRQVRTPLAVYP